MTDDWGIICGMQANAEGAVPEEGAGRTEGALTWYCTVRDFAMFWCSGGMQRRSCGGCVGRPPGKQEQRASMLQACRFRFRCSRSAGCCFAVAHDARRRGVGMGNREPGIAQGRLVLGNGSRQGTPVRSCPGVGCATSVVPEEECRLKIRVLERS